MAGEAEHSPLEWVARGAREEEGGGPCGPGSKERKLTWWS